MWIADAGTGYHFPLICDDCYVNDDTIWDRFITIMHWSAPHRGQYQCSNCPCYEDLL